MELVYLRSKTKSGLKQFYRLKLNATKTHMIELPWFFNEGFTPCPSVVRYKLGERERVSFISIPTNQPTNQPCINLWSEALVYLIYLVMFILFMRMQNIFASWRPLLALLSYKLEGHYKMSTRKWGKTHVTRNHFQEGVEKYLAKFQLKMVPCCIRLLWGAWKVTGNIRNRKGEYSV